MAATPAAAALANWERSFGVDIGGPGIDVCTVAANCIDPNQQRDRMGVASRQPMTLRSTHPGMFTSPTASTTVSSKFDSDGNYVRTWGWNVDKGHPGDSGICTVATQCDEGQPAGGGSGVDARQAGIAVSPGGEVYVVETDGDRVSVFDSDGRWLRSVRRGSRDRRGRLRDVHLRS